MSHHEKLQAVVRELHAKQLFFIGGTVKSGTTWLQLMLDAHPEVSCSGEGHFLDNLMPALRMALDQHCGLVADKNRTLFKGLDGYPCLDNDDFACILEVCIGLFLMAQNRRKTACAVGEKTPDNSRYFPELSRLFPSAKFVHVVRDGRDCAVSGWFHNLRLQPDETRKSFPSFGLYARAFAQVWAAELATAQSFVDACPGRIRQVRYEDIAADPRGAMARILAFLGVESSSRIVDQIAGDTSFEKLTGGRMPGQEDRASFFRKGISGDWKNYLGDADHVAFHQIAGPWMGRFGYH